MKYFKKLKREIKKINIKTQFNKYIKKFKNYAIANKELPLLVIPFLLLHVFVTIMCFNVNYTTYNYITPLLFSSLWIMLFLSICLNLKSKIGKIIYLLITLIFSGLYFCNGVYYSLMNTFFNFSLLESASEGAPYIIDTLKSCNPLIYVSFILITASIILAVIKFPKNDNYRFKTMGIFVVLFIILHTLTPLTLGIARTELVWSSWRNARNIYNAYNDSNKSLKISGFFEYEIRDFYITFLKTQEKEDEEEVAFLKATYSEINKEKNKYTSLLKDKNLIIVQLEGMDNWIVNKKDTPTIYKMMNEGINFTNHYSFYNGGGSTFNSEFAINTGYVTPYSYTKNAYTFNKNNFPNSLANIFKSMDYTVNAFHMNTGEYYSRTINYLNWGYDNYYSLKDDKVYTDNSYELDRELMLNERFNELMFPEDKKFVNYIITYSGHTPFSSKKGVCKMLYDIDKEDKETKEEKEDNKEETIITEEDCIRRQNQETDYMMQLLLEKLEEKDLLDNTAIVVITDHYLYTVKDQTILEKYKDTSNNLINKTPFYIWSKGIKSQKIKQVTSQLNVLPTILNLYGVNYNVNNYIGEDALDIKYKGLVFFNNYSWYDGNVYVDGGVVTNGKKISAEDLDSKNYKVSYLTKKNDLTLKYNYFKK